MSKRLSMIIAAVFGASACVTDQPLLVTGLYSLDPDRKGTCTSTTVQQGSGSLDLAGGGAYVMEIAMENDLDGSQALDTKAGDNTLITGLHRNAIQLDTVTFTYTSVPAVTFSTESSPLAFVLPPALGGVGVTEKIRTQLFTRNALEKLFASLPGTTNAGGLDIRDVKVKIVFSGSLVSGGRVSSTPIIYPVTVFNSGVTCPTAGDTFGRLGPCGNFGGQDGSRVCCASDATCIFPK